MSYKLLQHRRKSYDYNSKIYLAEVILNIKDLAGQTETAF
ncbi:protein of unknown function [Streptococcus thermophilus]|nr:protein of unknown function [Streptococcus thermophilus]